MPVRPPRPPRHIPGRPRLMRYFRPLRRAPGSVQLGLTSESGGVLLTGLSEDEIALLPRLDGTLNEHEVYAAGAATGVSHQRVRQLLSLLREHRLLVAEEADRAHLGQLSGELRQALAVDADVLCLAYDGAEDGFRRILDRRRQHVLVGGRGRLPWAIASLLRAGGVGRVEVGTAAIEVHDQHLRARDGTRGAPGVGIPDLVILVAEGALDPRLGDPWQRRGVAHLPVVGDGHRILIGPLAGHSDELPCLRCLDMYRTDRDAAWPAIMAQVCPAAGADTEVSGESTLVATAAGVVAMVAHTLLAGESVPGGVSIELAMPWPRMDHRRWHRHPACPGHATAYRGAKPQPAAATMSR